MWIKAIKKNWPITKLFLTHLTSSISLSKKYEKVSGKKGVYLASFQADSLHKRPPTSRWFGIQDSIFVEGWKIEKNYGKTQRKMAWFLFSDWKSTKFKNTSFFLNERCEIFCLRHICGNRYINVENVLTSLLLIFYSVKGTQS